MILVSQVIQYEVILILLLLLSLFLFLDFISHKDPLFLFQLKHIFTLKYIFLKK